MDFIMECKNVSYAYPLTKINALENISINIERGKFYGVIGANGSGKTTFCAMLRGFIPDFYKGEMSGEVLLDNKKISEYGPNIAKKIGYAFQNPFTQISGVKETVFEEVAYGLENFGVNEEEIERRVVEVMKLTDIIKLADQNPFDLSGGQMQRVALASVIVLEPDLLIIDEPTSQLDPEGTESIFKIIKALKEKEKTIILVEHKVDLLAEYSDNIIVLKDGKIKKSGKKEDILSDLSLLDDGISIPRVAILGDKLRKAGLNIDKIPVTEEEAIALIEKTMGNKL